MLCTWFRLKYPQWVDGCISASAPITSFMGEVPQVNYNFFADGETYDCKQEGGNPNDNCAANFQNTWDIIFTKATSAQGLFSCFFLHHSLNTHSKIQKYNISSNRT